MSPSKNNLWHQNARASLKEANSCNEFFQTDVFENQSFPIKIPLEFANLIDKDNPNDPLLRQVISSKPKLKDSEFSLSPLEDDRHSPVSGLIHKYPNRVLLIASRVCAIHCQYCFRQNFDYQRHDAISNWIQVENYISNNSQINEIILSGGDPFSLSDDKLELLISNIEKIKHIKTLRIHSRSAVVTPSRITDKLADILNNSKLSVVLVLHTNHMRELSEQFASVVNKLDGITLLNQSVLLKGVNDSLESLSTLSLRLFSLGILPYYLHLLDKVSGTEHFLVSDKRAKQLHKELKANLSGYLVPKLVRDKNTESKVWL